VGLSPFFKLYCILLKPRENADLCRNSDEIQFSGKQAGLATRWKQMEVITAIGLQVAMHGSFAGCLAWPAVWCKRILLPTAAAPPKEKPAPES
jgi:hypothetical protein